MMDKFFWSGHQQRTSHKMEHAVGKDNFFTDQLSRSLLSNLLISYDLMNFEYFLEIESSSRKMKAPLKPTRYDSPPTISLIQKFHSSTSKCKLNLQTYDFPSSSHTSPINPTEPQDIPSTSKSTLKEMQPPTKFSQSKSSIPINNSLDSTYDLNPPRSSTSINAYPPNYIPPPVITLAMLKEQ